MRVRAWRRERARRGDRGKDFDPRKRAFHHAMWAMCQDHGADGGHDLRPRRAALRTDCRGERGLAGADAKAAALPGEAEIEHKLLAMLGVDGFVVCPEQGQRICDGKDDACLGQPENDRAGLAERKCSQLLMVAQPERGLRRTTKHAIRSPREFYIMRGPAGKFGERARHAHDKGAGLGAERLADPLRDARRRPREEMHLDG